MNMNGSLISENSEIHQSVIIGRFCIIEDSVVLNDGVVVEDYAIVMKGAVVGKNTKIGTYTKIGQNVVIGEGSSFTSFCEIRDNCQVGNNVTMGSRGTLSAGTIVEDDVVMKYAFVVTDTPDLTKNNQKVTGRLKRGSKFGASVVIMPGLEIGQNSEVGACTQVRKNIPDNEVWFGMPAKFYRNSIES
jgi:UDP-2-acetamido-3-amino-2,3-dideoxy-glucuronate N-acetyltransferase